MKLSVHLVTWNGSKYIEYLFDSLRKQIYTDWKLVILDNGSKDNTVEMIKKELLNFPVEYELVEGKENLGFSGGHNKLFGSYVLSPTSYVLLLNQDMYLKSNCLEKMIKFMNEHEDCAVVSPRLMKWEFDKVQNTHLPAQAGSNIQDSFSDKIDTLGLKVLRNRRVIEKYTGKDWDEKKSKLELSHHTTDEAMEVFGVSGAFPMLRKSLIDKVGLFDELYFLYKEDVDLAYRLRIAGYKAFVLLDTVAYHDRSAEGLEKKGDMVAMANKKKQSSWVKYHSYKNHLMTLYKNEYWQNLLLDWPWIKWYELKKFVYFLIFDRSVLKGLMEIWRNRKDLKIKRLQIKKLRKVGWKELRVWFK
ncbi:MAG: glycosyltransferase family 2 protein [Candidatus Magasanikiibacteriota bacterium]